MTLWAVEGGAGTGKTTRLMQRLREVLEAASLGKDERVLALTFMHGSRRRLEDRLRDLRSDIQFGFDCTTLDSVAHRIVRRWSSLVIAMGLPMVADDDYEAQCDTAALLLERENVRAWLVARYPVLVVDEAQDLSPARLQVVQRLASLATTLVAADEFQCLTESLRPNPAVAWLQQGCLPETLMSSRRTQSSSLLAAAVALRSGIAVKRGTDFQICVGKGVPFAAAILANEISRNLNSSFAVITPTRAAYVRATVDRVASTACGKAKLGPYRINWENVQVDVASQLVSSLTIGEENDIENILTELAKHRDNSIAVDVAAWLRRQRTLFGRQIFTRAEVDRAVRRLGANSARFVQSSQRVRLALTIHQAKNREFDVVVVVWPYQVGGDAEQKRRLLYNAVTRAKQKCTVIVQGSNILKGPPFC